jgi:hypothetical protein
MSLDRKTFLRRLGAGAVGLAAAGSVRGLDAAPLALPGFDPARPERFWEDVRALYPSSTIRFI